MKNSQMQTKNFRNYSAINKNAQLQRLDANNLYTILQIKLIQYNYQKQKR